MSAAIAMERFRENIPDRPYCSYGKVISHINKKRTALEFPNIQINNPWLGSYITFDLDFEKSALFHEEKGLPCPTFTVINKDNHYSHLIYEIGAFPFNNASRSSKQLLKDVVFGYKELLCADKVITHQRQLVKNPLHDKWEVIQGGRPYSLTELVEYIPNKIKLKQRGIRVVDKDFLNGIRPFEDTLDPDSRNCSIFDNARYYAYLIACESKSYSELEKRVLLYVTNLNEIEVPKYFHCKVPHGELVNIARSISYWTYKNRSSLRKAMVNVGAMGLPTMKGRYWKPDDYIKVVRKRQQQAAAWTHEARRKKSEEDINNAIRECVLSKKKPTKTEVARMIGMSRVNISKRYSHLFEKKGGIVTL